MSEEMLIGVLSPTCNHQWSAPRVEVPDSVDVPHVCALDANHDAEHICSCGHVCQ